MVLPAALCPTASRSILSGASTNFRHQQVAIQIKRFLKDRKRFYKNVGISRSNGAFEINLDKGKLKTPLGTLFTVPTEPLAIAVATEWQSQKEYIKKHSMYLTTLCNSAIDNPTERTKDAVMGSIMHFLETDTLCFRLEDPPELATLQIGHWEPAVKWFNDRFEADVVPTTSLIPPPVSEGTRGSLMKHLNSHGDWALVGFESAVHCLKSLMLTLALMERVFDPETAVKLSRLELNFQVAKWGNVEWSHDIEFADLKARVSAAALFVQLISESSRTMRKVLP